MSENISSNSFEKDIQKNNERNFASTLDTIAKHSETIEVKAGETQEGNPFTDILFVLRGGSHSTDKLKDMQINLSLDSTVRAIVTVDGSAVLVKSPLSIGRVETILSEQTELDSKLTKGVDERAAESKLDANEKMIDSLDDIEASIRAGLGHTFGGDKP